MSDALNIQYLTNSEIDKTKWDQCIANASNGLIYGYSFYLDAMSKNWDALVLTKESPSGNEYEAVMPLPWNKKWGFRYLYQPFLTAQLGIFGNQLTTAHTEQFIEKARASFSYIDICLNSKNNTAGSAAFIHLRSNYLLELSNSYENLYSGFSENIQRNIKRAAQLGCSVQKGFDAEQVIQLAVRQMKQQGNSAGENIDRFRKLYKTLLDKQMAITYGIVTATGQLLASCVFFLSHNRAYYILVGNHPDSKNTGASHALIDAFIKDHSATSLLLDFEGSDIPGLANFYKSFGATLERYPALKINQLPFYIKWLKK